MQSTALNLGEVSAYRAGGRAGSVSLGAELSESRGSVAFLQL